MKIPSPASTSSTMLHTSSDICQHFCVPLTLYQTAEASVTCSARRSSGCSCCWESWAALLCSWDQSWLGCGDDSLPPLMLGWEYHPTFINMEFSNFPQPNQIGNIKLESNSRLFGDKIKHGITVGSGFGDVI